MPPAGPRLFARRIIFLRHVPTVGRDIVVLLARCARHQAGLTPDDARCSSGGVFSILISFGGALRTG